MRAIPTSTEKYLGDWTVRTGQLTTCKYAAGGWHTLVARVAGGRIEMYVDTTLIATWVDTTPLPSYGFGLMTFNGAASFDNIKVYGLSTRSYYAFGAARVAERTTSHVQAAGSGAAPGGGWAYYLAADHLGSTSLALTTSGVVTGTRAYYMPYGAERGPAASLPTDFTYTGQRTTDYIKLHQMGVGWYDPRLSQWTQPDSIVPQPINPQTFNRYSYVNDNPQRYTDPSGHCQMDETELDPYADDLECWNAYWAILPKLGYGDERVGPEGLDGWNLPDLLGLTHFIDAYHIKFERGGGFFGNFYNIDWNGDSLRAAYRAFTRVQAFLGANAGLSLNGLQMVRSASMLGDNGGGLYYPGKDMLRVSRDFIDHDIELQTETLVHELGHAADWNMGGGTYWSAQNSAWWSQVAGWHQLKFGDNITWYEDPQYIETAATVAQPNNPWEDFATTFEYMVEARYGGGSKNGNIVRGGPSRERQRALTVYFWPSSR